MITGELKTTGTELMVSKKRKTGHNNTYTQCPAGHYAQLNP